MWYSSHLHLVQNEALLITLLLHSLQILLNNLTKKRERDVPFLVEVDSPKNVEKQSDRTKVAIIVYPQNTFHELHHYFTVHQGLWLSSQFPILKLKHDLIFRNEKTTNRRGENPCK